MLFVILVLIPPPCTSKFLCCFLTNPRASVTSKRTLSSHKMTYNSRKSTGDISMRVLKISVLSFELTSPTSGNMQILFPCKTNLSFPLTKAIIWYFFLNKVKINNWTLTVSSLDNCRVCCYFPALTALNCNTGTFLVIMEDPL